jgi:hypothetical protein
MKNNYTYDVPANLEFGLVGHVHVNDIGGRRGLVSP